ncbi:MAG: hypothetical protein ABJA62_08670, partial [Luteimonas sp.]
LCNNLLTIVAFAAILLASGTAIADELIDFEGISTPTTLIYQYQNKGVHFNAPQVRSYADLPGFAHSGTQAAEVCFAIEFCSAPLSVDFGIDQLRVAMWVGSSGPLPEARVVTLRAFDVNDGLIGESNVTLPANTQPTPVNTQILISTPTRQIRRITLSFAATPTGTFNNGLVVDDLEFDAASFVACNGPSFPSISLSSPANPSNVIVNNFLLSGQVTTVGELLEANATAVSSSGSKRIELLGVTIDSLGGFFATQLSGGLSPGPNTITLRVRNCRGSAEVSSTIDYSPIPVGAKLKLEGLEVIQATQDLSNTVPLVSNKPTIVRAYISTEGSAAPIYGITGDLTVTRVGGLALPPVVHSMNSVTADTTSIFRKRLGINRSLNFELPAAHIGSGTYHLQITGLTVGGLITSVPCDNCAHLDSIGAPLWTQFQPTRDLNLVVAPYRYTRSPATQTPDLFFTPAAALQWTNNVFPLQGRFPVVGSGINLLRILPMRDTGRNLCFDCDAGDTFLDELDDLVSDLEDQNEGIWPSGFKLAALTPCGCGGRAHINGRVAYADDWNQESGIVPVDSFGQYGKILAHELAHTFGRHHAGSAHGEEGADSNFPYPHGWLAEPGLAITTEWWNGSPWLFIPGDPAAQHAHDLMSYGGPNWASPYTYKGLFSKLAQQAAAARLGVPSKQLVVIGHISKGKATIRPMRTVVVRRKPDDGETGSHAIELLDASGRALATHRFDPESTADGSVPSLGFSLHIPWHDGVAAIQLRSPSGILMRREVSRIPPTVSGVRAALSLKNAGSLLVNWVAADPDSSFLQATILYRAKPSDAWLPVADVSGQNRAAIDTSNLPGSLDGELRVRVNDGLNTSEATGRVAIPKKVPIAAILSPKVVTMKQGDATELVGAGYDAEDGLLADDRLSWETSDKQTLGHGGRIALARLDSGSHRVVLNARDADGNVSRAVVTVVVQPAAQQQTFPAKPAAI